MNVYCSEGKRLLVSVDEMVVGVADGTCGFLLICLLVLVLFVLRRLP